MSASRLASKPGRYPAQVAGGLLLLLAALLLVVTPPAPGRSRDKTPPQFAGLESAVTCIPGPGGGDRTTTYHLRWEPATDDVTRSRWIVYHVYQATTPGGQDFSRPTYRTRPGRTSFDTPPLPVNETFYFIVRAVDRAGNVDSNTVEQQGQNLCV